MRAFVVFVTMALLTGAGWLWYQVRDAHDSWSSYVVQTEESRLVEARRVEEMLRDGRVEEALGHLQRNRDVFVLQMASTRSAIDMASWRWNRNEHTLERAATALREEAEYRNAVGDSNSRIAQQVQIVLDEFKQ